jgi:hypothetical protein
MTRYYVCEDGNDMAIKVFDSAFDAINYAEENEDVKEVFEYVTDDKEHECIGLIYKKGDN